MNNTNNKKLATNYFVSKLYDWGDFTDQNNDLSTLKVLKLLFFCVAVNSKKGEKSILLDDVFNSFYALPFGHVESEVYNFIKRDELDYSITKAMAEKKNTTSQSESSLEQIPGVIKREIDSGIKSLQEINKDLIKLNSFDLVELSHSWFSWKYFFNKARQQNNFSAKIPNNIIKSETKILHLGYTQ